jgi:two-component system chemotaxis response regulator CheB
MPCDLVVVGASAGGVNALEALVQKLPSTLPAAIGVVLHVPAWRKSALPEILSRAGSLSAVHAVDGELITPGRIYVAPPDLHMLINRDRIELWRGPKENLHRPAVNPLFRSAATAYGPRAAGVVLSGAQDDGAAGLWWIKKYGGTAIAQDPFEAEHPSMPQSAIDTVGVDHVAPIAEIARLLTWLVAGARPITPRATEGWSEHG